jgi:transposase
MRGDDQQQLDVFSYVSPEQRVPQDHPLRPLRAMADEALGELQSRFRRLYAKTGRPSIAPEKLLRSLLLQVLYSVRSERMLMEQLNYNLLFRWFVGLNMDDEIWDATVFTKNRQRLLDGDIANAFFAAVLKQARQRDLLSDEHFTVDGTLLEAWAGQKSFRRVDDNQQPPATRMNEGSNPTVNFHDEKRSNETHCSTTDPDAMLARKSRGTGAVLAYRGHLLTENRNGLVVSTLTTRGYGSAERDAALLMAEAIPGKNRVTLGADKGYDTHDFVAELRHMEITPHICAERHEPSQRRGRTYYAPCWVSTQPEGTQTNRRGIRLDEKHRAVAQATASRTGESRVDVHLHGSSLQHGAHPQSDAQCPIAEVCLRGAPSRYESPHNQKNRQIEL